MGDTMREEFEVWELNYRRSTWHPLPSDSRKEMPAHWNTADTSARWLGYQVGHEAGRQLGMEQARAELAKTGEAVEVEPLVRFCPGCGSVGPVPEEFRDCCPDGGHARAIPESLADRCRDLFQLALRDALAQPAANADSVNTPTPQPAAERVALSDDAAMRVVINACDSLNITRVHEVGGKTRTICDEAGLLEIVRAIEAAHGIGQQGLVSAKG